MSKINASQRKKTILNYLYAVLIGVLVIACAVTIALVNSHQISSNEMEVNTETNVTPNEKVPVAAVTFVVPINNATIAKDYSATELQYNDTLKQWEIHKAIDFIANDDLNVYSVSDGTVSNIYTNYLEGTVVEISHANGLISIYKSLNEDVTVDVGDKVGAGTVIGTVGQTMAQEVNAGAHLHLEMLKNGVKVNPNDYIDLGNK